MQSTKVFSLTGEPDAPAVIDDESRRASDQGAWQHLSGDIEGARASYLAALERDPDNATAHNNLGFLLAQQGDVEGAIAHYERALELEPRKSMALANLGLARAVQGEMDAAVEMLGRAVEADPRNVLAWDNLAKLLLRAGRLAQAEACWRHAI